MREREEEGGERTPRLLGFNSSPASHLLVYIIFT
jgi:hypothetical protein